MILRKLAVFSVLLLSASVGALADDLSTAPSDHLLQVYSQLRRLQGGPQFAITENVVWKRDAATFTFQTGNLTFGAPVAGRVVAAVFNGDATFELDPPTGIDKHQMSRFTGQPNLVDNFKHAVFFFTDDSFAELQEQMTIRGGGDAAAATTALNEAENKYENDFNNWWANERKGNFDMRNLPARMLADLTDPSSKGMFLADLKCNRAGDLLFAINWSRQPLLLPELASDEEITLLHYKLGQYYEWWSGFHLASEYTANPHPSHPLIFVHCANTTIDATISKSNKLSANADMSIEVEQGTPRVLPLNLANVLRISSVTDGQGNKLAYIQEPRDQDSDPWVILPGPSKAGNKCELKISYDEDSTRDSRVIFQQGSGLYYVTARESWYPSFGAFQDRTMFDLHFTSPKEYQFVATGDEVNHQKGGKELVTEWKSPMPFSVAGFNYGRFVESTQKPGSMAVTVYGGKEVPDELRGLQAAMNQNELARGPGGGDETMRTGILTGGFNTAHNVKYAAALSAQAMQFYQFFFGALPMKTVSVTEQPVRGYAQSWPMLIFLPYDSLLDSTTLNSLGLYSSPEERDFYNEVAIHEMAHQWWGHLVGWRTYHDQWLSEGFADFSAALFFRQFEPKLLKNFWDLDRKWLLSKDALGNRPVDVGPLWLNYQTNRYNEDQVSTILIYRKGAYVLEMLRALMEDPRAKVPDGTFISMMEDFTKTYAGRDASTEDFEKIVEKHINQPMDWFFNEWVYGTETPHYDFKYQLSDGVGGKTLLKFTLTQSDVDPTFYMTVPVYMEVKGRVFRLGRLGIKGSSSVDQSVMLTFRPERVEIDPDHNLLCTESQ